jgi:hypothetical protein
MDSRPPIPRLTRASRPARPRLAQGQPWPHSARARRGAALLAFLALGCALPAAAAQYSVLIQGNAAGEMTVDREAETLRVTFSFNDRGRGPELTSTIRLDAQGLPVEVTTTGNEYFKGAVDETFRREDGRATWRNRGESGDAAVASPAFYVSFDGTPLEVGLLAAALLRHDGPSLDLLPAGSARRGAVDDRLVRRDGEERRVRRVEVEGLGFAPETVWLDEDGTFFAAISGWFSVIAAGWEGRRRQRQDPDPRPLRHARPLRAGGRPAQHRRRRHQRARPRQHARPRRHGSNCRRSSTPAR